MTNHRTTAADFRLFVAECRRCIKRWKIVGVRVEFGHKKIDGRAEIRTGSGTATAEIYLGTEWGEETPTRDAVLDSARHEVIHLILDPLNHCMVSRYLTDDERRAALERTVRHLQELLP